MSEMLNGPMYLGFVSHVLGKLCLKWCCLWDLVIAIVVNESGLYQMVSPTISRIYHTRFGHISLCLNRSLILTIGLKVIGGVVPKES